MEIQEDIGRVLVIIPTYNERENIESITGRVRAAVPEDLEGIVAKWKDG